MNEKNRAYYYKNREKILKKPKEPLTEEEKIKQKEYNKQYYQKHKEELKMKRLKGE